MSTETAGLTLRETLRALTVKPRRAVTLTTVSEGQHKLSVNGWCAPTLTAVRAAVVKGGAKGKAIDGAEKGGAVFGDQSYEIPPGEDKGGAVIDAIINDMEPTADNE